MTEMEDKKIKKWLKKSWLVKKKDINRLLKKFIAEYKGDITFIPEVLIPYMEKQAIPVSVDSITAVYREMVRKWGTGILNSAIRSDAVEIATEK